MELSETEPFHMIYKLQGSNKFEWLVLWVKVKKKKRRNKKANMDSANNILIMIWEPEVFCLVFTDLGSGVQEGQERQENNSNASNLRSLFVYHIPDYIQE